MKNEKDICYITMAFVRCPECRTEIESLVPLFEYIRAEAHMKHMSDRPDILPENISLVENVENIQNYEAIFEALGLDRDHLCCRMHLTTKRDYMSSVVETGVVATMP